MEELWKPITGYEGLYEISNFGRVKSVARQMTHKKHGTWFIKERILKYNLAGVVGNQYYQVFLHKGNGIQKAFKIHRLVAEHFIPRIEGKNVVNHIDCNKLNNRVDNLEWVTDLENTKHAIDNGRLEGAFDYRKKLIINIDTGDIFPSQADAERYYGVARGAIGKCLKGKSKTSCGYRWRYVDEERVS